MNSSLLSGIFNGCNGSDSSQSIALALRTLTWLVAPCITPGGCRCPGVGAWFKHGGDKRVPGSGGCAMRQVSPHAGALDRDTSARSLCVNPH
jgi:hypothetical protein